MTYMKLNQYYASQKYAIHKTDLESQGYDIHETEPILCTQVKNMPDIRQNQYCV